MKPTRVHSASALAAALVLAGCIGGPAPERASYLPPAARSAPARTDTRPVAIKVRPFRATALFEAREFVYRMPGDRLVTDFYNGFAASPPELMTSATARWLKASKLVAAVIEPGVALDAPFSLEGEVIEMSADLRDEQQTAALVDVQFYLVRVAGGRELLLDRRYTERVAVADRSAAAIAKGCDAAMVRVLQRLEQDLAAVEWKEAGLTAATRR
jgi:cholesterol transport system auxiliary component